MCAYVFLKLNGFRFTASEAEVVITMLSLAAGELSEQELVQWFEANSVLTSQE